MRLQRQKRAEEGKEREIESEIERVSIENAAAIAPDGQPQGRLHSLFYMELALLAGVSLSYRKGLKLLNRLLRRGGENGVKFRTYLDLCQRVGKKAEESAARSEEELPPDTISDIKSR